MQRHTASPHHLYTMFFRGLQKLDVRKEQRRISAHLAASDGNPGARFALDEF